MVDYLEGGSKGHELMLRGVPLRVCANCGRQEEKLYKCSRCKAKGVHVLYCRLECQREHWGRHKGVVQDAGLIA